MWCVFGLLIAPLAKELLFRGVLLSGLRDRLAPFASAAIVTILFTAVHAAQYWRYWPALLFIFLLGALLAAARLRFGSIGPGIAAHFSYNVIAVAAVVFS